MMHCIGHGLMTALGLTPRCACNWVLQPWLNQRRRKRVNLGELIRLLPIDMHTHIYRLMDIHIDGYSVADIERKQIKRFNLLLVRQPYLGCSHGRHETKDISASRPRWLMVAWVL
ncbi:hypothetical protein Leryth_006493 [Lithospermum erythrorhizon]|nr:hypothetical protein Leryth_006493 [Lithospermum erythrorhizon]